MDASSLNDVLDRNTILTNLNANAKDDVIDALARRLREHGYIASVDAFVDAVHEREKEGATGDRKSVV